MIPKKLFYAAHQSHIIRVGDGWKHIKTPLPKDAVKHHLNGGPRYGVPFVRREDATVMAGMLDIDNHDGKSTWADIKEAAERLMMDGEHFGLRLIPFRSNGGAGINLWCIWDVPQQAAAVKACLSKLVEGVGYKVGSAGLSDGEIEVFPKQDRLEADEYGNAAALPRTPLDGWDLEDCDKADWMSSAPLKPIETEVVQTVESDITEAQLVDLLEYVPVAGIGYDAWWARVMAIYDDGGSKELAEE